MNIGRTIYFIPAGAADRYDKDRTKDAGSEKRMFAGAAFRTDFNDIDEGEEN